MPGMSFGRSSDDLLSPKPRFVTKSCRLIDSARCESIRSRHCHSLEHSRRCRGGFIFPMSTPFAGRKPMLTLNRTHLELGTEYSTLYPKLNASSQSPDLSKPFRFGEK